MLHIPYDSYTTWTLYIIHALASKRNVVCTRTIYLPLTVTSQFSTLTCGLVKSTASLAEDSILFHANHIEVTLHFYLYRVSKLNTHKYLRERSSLYRVYKHEACGPCDYKHDTNLGTG